MLWAQGNATQLPKGVTAMLQMLGAAAWALSRPMDWLLVKATGRKRLSLVVQSLRRRTIQFAGTLYEHFPKPDSFLLEVFNPMAIETRLHLRVRGDKDGKAGRFEWTNRAAPGFTSFAIPISDFERWIDLRRKFDLTLSIAEEQGKSLYFCSATFVRNAGQPKPAIASSTNGAHKKIKCVIWDLDHTLWDGILVESGEATLQLKDGVRTMLTELDRRGILLSIASKNSEDDARKMLQALGVWELFLSPRINWQPKSESIKQIAEKLNLGLDSFAFIDDMPFERDEVARALPTVTVVPAEQCLTLLGRPEFAGDNSAEGASRRHMYQTEMKRESARTDSSLGYDDFLATCGIRVHIKRPGDQDLPRLQDIVQRTNQLNISSHRYNLEEMRALIHSGSNQCFIISCADNYGDYGQVGFINFKVLESGLLIEDCMFSCRIQGKRIDEAVLAHLINRLLKPDTQTLRARFIPTKRNAPAAEMLAKLGFAPDPAGKEFLTIANPSPLQEIKYFRIESDLA